MNDIPGLDALYFIPLIDFCNNPPGFNMENYSSESKKYIRRTAARNLLLQSQLNEILTLFDKNSIDAAVLKGSYLDKLLYPPGIRPVGDIDLLVHKEDHTKVSEALRKISYFAETKGMPLDMQKNISGRVSYLKDSELGIPLDIHYSLGPYPYLAKIETEILWHNLVRAKINGLNVNVLDPGFAFLHHLLHLFHHIDGNWIVSCCDIAAMVHSEDFEINWNRFLKHAKEYNLHLPVLYSLNKILEVFGPIIPEIVTGELSLHNPSLKEKVLFNLSIRKSEKTDKNINYLIQFLSTPGILFKFRCIIRILIPYQGVLPESSRTGGRILRYLHYYLNLCKSFIFLFKSLFRRCK